MLGLGIAKGMLTTLRHMLAVKPVTIQYPEQTMEMPAWTRGRPRLIYDLDSGDLRCTACGACAIACPVDVIQIHMRPGPERGKKIMDRFDLDMGGCIECALCVEACPFRAIVMAPDFEMATYDRANSLVFNMHQLRIPGTPEVDAAMEYIQGVKRGLAGQAARGEAPARAGAAAGARPAPAAAVAEPAAAAPTADEAAGARRPPPKPPPAKAPAGMSPTRARMMAARAAQQAASQADETATVEATGAPPAPGEAARPLPTEPRSPEPGAQEAGQTPAATPAAHPAATPEAVEPSEQEQSETEPPRAAPRPPPTSGTPPMTPTRARLLASRGQQPPSGPDPSAPEDHTEPSSE
jgi:NADH-quinone oxidoreductase subunit I